MCAYPTAAICTVACNAHAELASRAAQWQEQKELQCIQHETLERTVAQLRLDKAGVEAAVSRVQSEAAAAHRTHASNVAQLQRQLQQAEHNVEVQARQAAQARASLEDQTRARVARESDVQQLTQQLKKSQQQSAALDSQHMADQREMEALHVRIQVCCFNV